ncbi:MAG: gliding motility-associated C-terminal domain-containing protein [Bacteroidetes bacterium]|nr:gliding motility-associated C-terminal domain-containing protein [Bacteroidota bacterium]
MRKNIFLLFFLFFNSLLCAQDHVPLPCETGIVIPTVFIGNNDGIPQLFRPYFSGIEPWYLTMEIYDTSNTLILTTYSPEEGWNGHYWNHGNVMPDGIYKWKISYQWTKKDSLLQCDGTVRCSDLEFNIAEVNDSIGCGIFIPNEMSSEDDNFRPRFVCPPLSFHMQIFDRWGNLIFESKDYNAGWDGRKNKNEIAPEGTYYVVIDCISNPGEVKKHCVTNLLLIR